jgi:hypothetical protein
MTREKGATHLLRRITVALVLSVAAAMALAQQPMPLLPSTPGPPSSGGAPTIEASPLAPPPAAPPAAETAPNPSTAPTAAFPAPQPAPVAAPAPPSRVFCDQNVAYRVADPAAVPEPYRQFIGVFSDAAWSPQLCAALIVEAVQGDGTAAISYVFGPMASGGKVPGGVLHGTGIVKDGALLFQNSDGSQYAFKPYYSDLAGRWTTPKGQTYESIFKRSY